jgi:hypothetical protein
MRLWGPGGLPVSLPAARSIGGLARAGRVPRGVAREIADARFRGEVSAATVRALAQVTHTGLTLTAMLTAEETRLVSMCPLGEARYRALVDQFTAAAAAEIATMSW